MKNKMSAWFGKFLMVGSIPFGAYWLLNDLPYKGWAVTLMSFILIIASIFTFEGRITNLKFWKDAVSISVARGQAEQDASEIADMKRNIERDRMRIDNLTKQLFATVREIKKDRPHLDLLAQYGNESPDGCFLAYMFSSPHKTVQTSATVEFTFSNEFYHYEKGTLRSLNKDPYTCLQSMETYDLGPHEGVATYTRQKSLTVTWDCRPGDYLVIKFWSEKALSVESIEWEP